MLYLTTMITFTRKNVKIFCNICCIMALVCMIGYWFYRYDIEDRDIGMVDYRSFKEEEEDVKYPIVAICFKTPIVERKLKDANARMNITTYVKYLKGDDNSRDIFKEIDYQNISLHLQDYFLYAHEKLFNQSRFHNSSSSFEHVNTFNGIYNHKLIKCYSVRMKNNDDRNIKSMVFFYDKEKFKRDIALEETTELSYYVSLHYPGQFLLGDDFLDIVPIDKSFFVEAHDIEIIRRRNNHRHQCYDGNVVYDDRMVVEHLSSKGCRPNYLKAGNLIPICSTMNETKASSYDYWGVRSIDIADDCLMISKKSERWIRILDLNEKIH